MRLRNAAGMPVTPWGGTDENTGQPLDLVFRAPRNGTYFVEAVADEPPSGPRYSISLTRALVGLPGRLGDDEPFDVTKVKSAGRAKAELRAMLADARRPFWRRWAGI